MKIFIASAFILLFTRVSAQDTYKDSLQTYINDYVKNHEVVKEKDKKYFRFFPVNENYRVTADFTKANNSPWFSVQTSGQQRKMYRVFGTVTFTINDTIVKANLYQAQSLLSDPKYKNYLVLMFTDKTTGNETYEAGRYIDFTMDDIKNNKLVIDFNKAYNPYCAYIKNQYNCPIPPKENSLPVAIQAGEKDYGKKID
jgi:uncharacterized protein (DUF1684 family)